jgi:hypothetical protein
MTEELKTGILSIMIIAAFFAIGITKFVKHDSVGIISGFVLLIISALIYLIATRRLRVYGEVFEQG